MVYVAESYGKGLRYKKNLINEVTAFNDNEVGNTVAVEIHER